MSSGYIIPNLGKAVQMLKVLASCERGMSAAEIETNLDIPRTTAFRILKTLQNEGMVIKEGTIFQAGTSLYEIGLNALSRSAIREKAIPLLQDLTAATGQTSHLAVPSGWHSLILEVCDSSGPVRVASRPGTLADLHCSATGKIFLSYLFSHQLDDFLRSVPVEGRTPNTIVEATALSVMCEQVRSAQYAVDEEEYHLGVRCLAAPVFDMQNVVAAAIGVTGPTTSFKKEDIGFVSTCVRKAAQRLSGLLGNKHIQNSQGVEL